ncbi:MAG: GGDEF domain-containing protein [Moraxellaceae bacterium]|nr:MAG: GGDEF domain-containing protein [Moraxellaceae bacterium]
MRLANFILENLERILQEWQEFAATLVPLEQQADKELLRDHLKQMLEAIALDLAAPQTVSEADLKSKGLSDVPDEQETAASIHGLDRLSLGFSLDAAMAEYRALRASVTRLWKEALAGEPFSISMMDDLIRFNEAVDQAISESVTSYSSEKEQETRVFDTILSSSPDLNFTFDLHGRFMYANQALRNVFELPLTKIIGKTHADLKLPDSDDRQREIQQVIETKKQYRGENEHINAQGVKAFYDYILVPTLDKNGNVEAVAGTARNITERKAAEDLNWHKANYDLLTGLPNRRLFTDRLEQDIKHAERVGAQVALLFIDLDRFKAANDNFGHDAGDILLRLVAERIRACIRETDTVARLGGDEFMVILQGFADIGHVEVVAEKILETLASPFKIFENTADISSSIGIAFYPKDAATAEELQKNSDQAMYSAKAGGRNRFSFYIETHQES